MHYSPFLIAFFAVICYTNIASASEYGVDCQCICCKRYSQENCTIFHQSYINLPLDQCDDDICYENCSATYPMCDHVRDAERKVSCTPGTLAALSSSTVSTETNQTVTFSSTTTSSSDTTATQVTTSSAQTTTSAGSDTTTSGAPVTTATGTGSNTTITNPSTTTSSANAFKSFFQVSHFAVFTVLLMLLCC